ncbi:hypothetical protein E2562_014291 [Oryza meyeriana var. granulata]|uniref:Uncharacterized protein n=1 Tax=Oryza meyeriana var. granulata TaxID=110450 RepID=A0A6G1C686_9ORYZ|nr:hypothetical protein E2562_014291 [Oryza meyeriana var. granulata]
MGQNFLTILRSHKTHASPLSLQLPQRGIQRREQEVGSLVDASVHPREGDRVRGAVGKGAWEETRWRRWRGEEQTGWPVAEMTGNVEKLGVESMAVLAVPG